LIDLRETKHVSVHLLALPHGSETAFKGVGVRVRAARRVLDNLALFLEMLYYPSISSFHLGNWAAEMPAAIGPLL
jgi:hypothetical protein